MSKILSSLEEFLQKNNFTEDFQNICHELGKDSYLIIDDDPFSARYFLKVLACFKARKTAILANPAWGKNETLNMMNSVKSFSFDPPHHALIVYSSGSSGKPKGIVHSLESLEQAANSSCLYFQMGTGERFMASLPQHHIGGLMIGIRAVIAQGTIGFKDPHQTLTEHLETNAYDYLSLVPAQLRELVDHEDLYQGLSSYKAIILGGAKSDDKLHTLVKDLPVYQTFGMSESGAMIMVKKNQEEGGFRIMPLRDVSLNKDGLLRIGSYGLMKGYFIEGSFKEIQKPFETNDLFRQEGGGFFFIGRRDLMINSGGENIDPIEVENTIKKINNVKYCHVIPRKDEKWGEVPVVFLEPITIENDVRNFLEKELLKYKCPKEYFPYPKDLKDQIDKSVKLSRQELKDRLQEK